MNTLPNHAIQIFRFSFVWNFRQTFLTIYLQASTLEAVGGIVEPAALFRYDIFQVKPHISYVVFIEFSFCTWNYSWQKHFFKFYMTVFFLPNSPPSVSCLWGMYCLPAQGDYKPTVHNILQFDSEPPQQAAFDISPCYPSQQKTRLLFKFSGTCYIHQTVQAAIFCRKR